MGGWKAVGPGLAPRAGRHPQVHEAPVADGHARVRARRATPHHFPYSAAGHPADGRRVRRARDERALRRRAAGDAGGALRHLHPLARAARRRRDPTGFWARAASHCSVPEESRSPCCRPGCADEQLAGLRDLLDSLAAERDGGGDAAGGARGRSCSRFSEPSPRRWRGSPPSAGSPVALLRAPRPRHRHATPTGTAIGYRAAYAAAGRAPSGRWRCAGPRAPTSDRGRRLRRRVGRRGG